MSDIVADLAARSGLTPEQVHKALGAVLSFAKKSLPESAFNQLSAAVPDSAQMMAAAETHEESSGGILDTLKGMAGKMFGGGSSAALLSKLSSLGISAEKLQSFLSQVVQSLKGKCPDSVVEKLNELVPTPQETSV
jgi:hypothetical protein